MFNREGIRNFEQFKYLTNLKKFVIVNCNDKKI